MRKGNCETCGGAMVCVDCTESTSSQCWQDERARAESAESQVAALTASLASMSALQTDTSIRLGLEHGKLAELRKRMGEERGEVVKMLPLIQDAVERGGASANLTKATVMLSYLRDFLASPPSPAPVESKPKEESK